MTVQNRWSSFGIVGYVEGMTLQKHEMEMSIYAVVPPVGGIQPYQTPIPQSYNSNSPGTSLKIPFK